LFPTIIGCVLNQSNDHWLLNDTSNFATLISLMKREKIKISSTANNFMNNNSKVAFELSLLVSNIKKKKCGMLKSFLSFLRKYIKKEKNYHMFF
jgi:hypothetical protein